MKLIAKKPCSFGGKNFFIGDEVPESLVVNPTAQEKQGVITIVNMAADKVEEDSEATAPYLSVKTTEGKILLSHDQAQILIEILQLNTENASDAIEHISNEDVLMAIENIENRSTVKKAIKNRLANLSTFDDKKDGPDNGNKVIEA